MSKPKKTQPQPEVEVPAAVAGMMAVNPIMAKAWMDMMTECSRFVTERLQRDMELQQRLLACRTPLELMQVQQAFLQETMDQYTEEAARAFKMMFKSASDIEDDVRTGHKRAYNDIPV